MISMQVDWGSPCWIGQSSEPVVEAGDFAELIEKYMPDMLRRINVGCWGEGST